MKHIIAHRIHPEEVRQSVYIDHVSLGLAHLAAVHQKPGMPEHLLRQRLVQRHQEYGPINGMEADDIFPDQMQIRGPELLILLTAVPLCIIADACDIIGQGVQPHIHHMTRIEIHGNPPLKGGSGNTQILQSGQKEVVHHLVLAGHGLNEFRMLVDMLDQLIRIFAHAEEIRLLLGRLYLPAAVRALAVHKLGFRPEGLAGSAVHSLVCPFINIPLIIQTLENLLDLTLMILIRGSDELVIGSVQQVAHSLNDPRHLVHELLGRHPRLLSLQLDLLSMLVRAGLEEDIIPFLALEPGDAVRQHDLIIVAYMGLT